MFLTGFNRGIGEIAALRQTNSAWRCACAPRAWPRSATPDDSVAINAHTA